MLFDNEVIFLIYYVELLWLKITNNSYTHLLT